MKESDAKKFHALYEMLFTAFGKPIDAKRESIYFAALRHYDITEVEYGIKIAIREGDGKVSGGVPLISDICRAIEGSIDEIASQAWYTLLRALDEIGIDNTVDLGDRALHQTALELDLWGSGIEQKGYPEARATGATIPQSRNDGMYYVAERTDQSAYLRAEFIKRYKIHRKEPQATMPGKLLGLRVLEQKRNLALYGYAWKPEMRELAENKIFQELSQPVALKPAIPMENRSTFAPKALNPSIKSQKSLPMRTTQENANMPTAAEKAEFIQKLNTFMRSGGAIVASGKLYRPLPEEAAVARRKALEKQAEEIKK